MSAAPTFPASPAVERRDAMIQAAFENLPSPYEIDTTDPDAMGVLVDAVLALAAPPTPRAEEKRCEYCDGTGDVHRADGEWLGTCDCATPRAEIGDEARARAVLEDDISCALSDDTPISPSHAIAAMLAFAAATPAPVVGDGPDTSLDGRCGFSAPTALGGTRSPEWRQACEHLAARYEYWKMPDRAAAIRAGEPGWLIEQACVEAIMSLAATPASVTPDAGEPMQIEPHDQIGGGPANFPFLASLDEGDPVGIVRKYLEDASELVDAAGASRYGGWEKLVKARAAFESIVAASHTEDGK